MRYILLVVIFVFLLKLFILGAQLHTGIVLHNTLDFSWQSDIVERFLHGFIAGRDFIFTYGPLYQLIASLPAVILGQATYTSVLYTQILLSVFSVIFLYFIVAFLVKDRKERIFLLVYLVFFIGLIDYESNSLLRFLLPFFYSLLLLRFLSVKKMPSVRTIIILSLPTIFGMYTFDLFILCLLITFFLLIYKLISDRSSFLFSVSVGIFQLFLVFAYVVLASFLLSGGLRYLLYSLDTLSNYQFIMSIPWSTHTNFLLLCFPFALIFLLIYLLQKTNNPHRLKVSLIVLTVVSFLQLKSAFIRADDGHVLMGIYPSLLVLFIVFYFVLRERLRIYLVFTFLIFYLLIPFRGSYFSSISIQNLQSAIAFASERQDFFAIYRLPEEYYFTGQDFSIFESLIRKNPGKVMIYPYDSYILNIYHTTFNTLPLQFYEYSSSVVEQDAVSKLSKTPPEFIILSLDSKGAVALDDIPNFSRNPLIAKFIIRNYSIYSVYKNYFILRFDPDQKLKKENKKGSACTIYDIDVSKVMKSNFLERFGKTSTFYLDNITARLPYVADTKDVFIVEKSGDSQMMRSVFERKIDFDNFSLETKKLSIIKKSPLPHLSHTYTQNFFVKCY